MYFDFLCVCMSARNRDEIIANCVCVIVIALFYPSNRFFHYILPYEQKLDYSRVKGKFMKFILYFNFKF